MRGKVGATASSPAASDAAMFFLDRLDAGRQLAAAFSHHRGSGPLVLAIPRGAAAP